MRKGMLFKVISLVLVNAFLVLDLAWAGGAEMSVVKPTEMLSAPVQISQQEFSVAFDGLYKIKTPSIDAGRKQNATEKTAKFRLKIRENILKAGELLSGSPVVFQGRGELGSKVINVLMVFLFLVCPAGCMYTRNINWGGYGYDQFVKNPYSSSFSNESQNQPISYELEKYYELNFSKYVGLFYIDAYSGRGSYRGIENKIVTLEKMLESLSNEFDNEELKLLRNILEAGKSEKAVSRDYKYNKIIEKLFEIALKKTKYVDESRNQDIAVGFLNQIKVKGDADKAVSALESEDLGVKKSAIRILGGTGNNKYEDALLAHLKGDTSLNVIIALGEIKSLKSVSRLIDIMTDQNCEEALRAAAAWALGEIGDKKAVEPLILSLNQYRVVYEIKERAVVEGRLWSPPVYWEEKGIFKMPLSGLRSRAIEALGKIRSSKALEGLIINFGKENEYITAEVVPVLKEIGDPRAFKPLWNFLLSIKSSINSRSGSESDKLAFRTGVTALMDMDKESAMINFLNYLSGINKGDIGYFELILADAVLNNNGMNPGRLKGISAGKYLSEAVEYIRKRIKDSGEAVYYLVGLTPGEKVTEAFRDFLKKQETISLREKVRWAEMDAGVEDFEKVYAIPFDEMSPKVKSLIDSWLNGFLRDKNIKALGLALEGRWADQAEEYLLKICKDRDAEPELIKLLNSDQSERVKIRVVKILAAMGTEGAARAIEDTLQNTEPWLNGDLWVSCVKMLGKIGNVKSIDVIIREFNKKTNLSADQDKAVYVTLKSFGEKVIGPLAIALCENHYKLVPLSKKILSDLGAEDKAADLLTLEFERGNQNAAGALVRLGRLPYLVDKMGILNDEVAVRVVYELGNLGDKAVINSLMQLYQKNKNIEVRIEIIRALGKIGDLRSLNFLERIVKEGPNAISRFFSEETSVGQVYSPDNLKLQREAEDAILEIKKKNDAHSSKGDKSIISLFLGVLAPSSAHAQGIGPEYYKYLRKAVEDKRRKEMSDLWIKALESADFQMREGAARMLINSEDPRAVFFGLLYESHKLGKDSNLEVIGRLPKAEEYALEALNSRIYWIKTGAITVLEKVGTEKAVEPLINLRKQNYEGVIRSKIIDALVNIGTKDVVQYLHDELKTMDKNENEIEYESLVFALGKIGDPGIVNELAKIYRSSDVGRNFMDQMFENIAAKSGFITRVKIEILKRPYVSAVLMLSLIGGMVIVIRVMIRKGGVEKGGKGLKNILLPVLLAPALITLSSTLGWTADASVQETVSWLSYFKDYWFLSGAGILLGFFALKNAHSHAVKILFPGKWTDNKLAELYKRKNSLEEEIKSGSQMTMEDAVEAESSEWSYRGTAHPYVSDVQRRENAENSLAMVNEDILRIQENLNAGIRKIEEKISDLNKQRETLVNRIEELRDENTLLSSSYREYLSGNSMYYVQDGILWGPDGWGGYQENLGRVEDHNGTTAKAKNAEITQGLEKEIEKIDSGIAAWEKKLMRKKSFNELKEGLTIKSGVLRLLSNPSVLMESI